MNCINENFGTKILPPMDNKKTSKVAIKQPLISDQLVEALTSKNYIRQHK